MRATWCLHRRPQFGPAGAVRLDRRRFAGRHLREPKASARFWGRARSRHHSCSNG